MNKYALFFIVTLVLSLYGEYGVSLEKTSGKPTLPNFTDASYEIVDEGYFESPCHPEWGFLKAIVYSDTGNAVKQGGNYIMIFLNHDESYRYVEWSYVYDMEDKKKEVSFILRGYLYKDNEFVFETEKGYMYNLN